MLTYEDCLAFCELSEEEIAAIAEHEHVPEIIAVELGAYLVHTESGEKQISRMIIDDISAHRKRGERERVECLELVLKHFLATHPRSKSALANSGEST